ncbi:MAG TPA: alpha-galactosidase, partial [Pedobacter sp.]
IAKTGKAFMPLDGNTGDKANEVFYRKMNGFLYVALLNYTKAQHEFNIPLSRLGLTKTSYNAKELFASAEINVDGSLKLSVSQQDAAILKIKLVK